MCQHHSTILMLALQGVVSLRWGTGLARYLYPLITHLPLWLYQAFLQGEVRYASLTMKNPDHAKALYEASEHNAVHRYESLLQRQASLEPKEGAAK